MAVELIPLNPDQHVITFIPKLTAELPFFNLTSYKKRDLTNAIKFDGLDEAGHPIHWEVFPNTNKKIGVPGVEAHRVWYLLIKPAIDEARLITGKISQVVPLGKVRECLRKIGFSAGGHQERELIKCLNQIGAAWCVADLWVPTKEVDESGRPKYVQVKGRFSRMSVYAIGDHHLTEEELNSAQFEYDLEDIIYLKLDPLEAMMQEAQDQRVYDNEYLFSVSPSARRWYELLAPKIFGTVKNKAPFCEIRYSWYVQHHHTLQRYNELKRVKFQMNRIVNDHLKAGYISKVEYRKIKEPNGEIDFIIRYFAGEGAKESIARIQGHLYRRRKTKQLANEGTEGYQQAGQGSSTTEITTATLTLITAEDAEMQQLLDQLMSGFGITAVKALELIRNNRQATKDQLTYFPYRGVTVKGNRAGWLIRAIEGGYSAPPGYEQVLAEKTQQAQNTARRLAIENCSLCDPKGFRLVKSERYPTGAMKQCSHDPSEEARYQS
jgi:hypothetical protein